MYPFFTIGHSTRSIPEFVELLREVQIELVVDVRTVPRSRTNPQFNRSTLPTTLSEFDIDYEHMAQLGGLRPPSPTVPPTLNAFWQNASFHNFADYAMSEEFTSGLARLRELGHAKRSAIMCAEAVWWRCHRRIITDHLPPARNGSIPHSRTKSRRTSANDACGEFECCGSAYLPCSG